MILPPAEPAEPGAPEAERGPGRGAEPPGGEPDATGLAGRGRPKKAPNAFRTISEVADDLHIPQHVLRFWETKFTQVKPLKRGGGRRYYRPDDIALLRRISDLLYIQGYTIKGVQRLLRESGGKLSDDIPPPAPEERQTEAERRMVAGGEEIDVPELGLPTPPETAARRADDLVAAREVERLRAVLRGTLRELEALRALLG